MKQLLRSALGAPFRVINSPQISERYHELGVHRAALKTKVDPIDHVHSLFGKEHWTLRKFNYTVRGKILLDTSLGWALSGLRILPNANATLLEWGGGPPKPNFAKWFAAQFTAKHYERVIWLPYGADNYWHFLNDFLGGLHLLQTEFDIKGTPVLINEQLYAKDYFKEIIGYSDFLSGLCWTPYNSKRWIQTDELLTAHTYYGTRETLQDAIGLLNKLPPVNTTAHQKIFLSRAPGGTRGAKNLSDVHRTLEARGFQIVYCEQLTVAQQQQTINSANVIAGLHGAGMVNIAFHREPTQVTVLEITPEDFINPCFGFLAEELGMNYYCMGAGPRDPSSNFDYSVPIEKLDLFLDKHVR